MSGVNIYTKGGDGGETSLYGGERVGKDAQRVWAYGSVDEACSVLGLIRASLVYPQLKEYVHVVQQRLFIAGAQLASDEEGRRKLGGAITEEDVALLESIIDDYTQRYGRSSSFVIPGETAISALFHVARTVVRRAERHVVALAREEFVPPPVLRYLNRLSDALFVMAKLEVIEDFVKIVAEKIVGISKEGEKMPTGLCEKMCAAAFEKSEKMGVPICFAVADAHGTLLYFSRQKGALMVSVGIAQQKAYTSAVLKMTTAELGRQAQPGQPLYGINVNDSNLVPFGGGAPLSVGGRTVGGVGVSGGSVEEDEIIAACAAEVFGNYLKEGGGGFER